MRYGSHSLSVHGLTMRSCNGDRVPRQSAWLTSTASNGTRSAHLAMTDNLKRTKTVPARDDERPHSPWREREPGRGCNVIAQVTVTPRLQPHAIARVGLPWLTLPHHEEAPLAATVK